MSNNTDMFLIHYLNGLKNIHGYLNFIVKVKLMSGFINKMYLLICLGKIN